MDLTVDLGDRSYVVHVGRGQEPETSGLLAEGRPVVVVTDENVARLHRETVDRFLEGREGERIVIPAGEGAKSFVTLEGVLERMAACGATRRWAVVAVGGGVVGDLGGLVAALFMRGLELVQVPTTLLSQVDSSVGGKTAINLFAGKNLAGAFWQPSDVWVDVELLGTLPAHEYASGLGEMAKHALLDGVEAVAALKDAAPALLRREVDVLEREVAASIAVKIRHVIDDEREAGVRAHLNLGHTVGHALELTADLPHGVAVALGILAETRMAEELGVAQSGAAAAVQELIEALDLPTKGEFPPTEAVVELMYRDKKRVASRELTAALLVTAGEARVVRELPQEAVEVAVDTLRA